MPVSDPYDTLMDDLATLAVEAVQHVETAVQVGWLYLLGTAPLARPAVAGFLKTLLPRAQDLFQAHAWAWPHAPRAFVRLAHTQRLVEVLPDVSPPDEEPLSWASLAGWGEVVVRLPVAYHPYAAEFHADIGRLWRAVTRLFGPRPAAWGQVPEEVVRGAVLFDAGLYFACHEFFETLWGRTGDPASPLFQGLIQVAVALRHLESHQVRGAVTLLQAGLDRLRRYPPHYQGLPLASFIDQLTRLQQQLQSKGSGYEFDPQAMPRLLGDEA